MTRQLCAAILLVATAGCEYDTPTIPNGPVDTQVVLAPGQTARIVTAAMDIRFDGVPSDSRCPADAVCIQSGDATVRIDVVQTSSSLQLYDLHTANGQSVRYADLTISLINLSPYPFSNGPILPGDYRATLRVTR